jgi:hypothetical protein
MIMTKEELYDYIGHLDRRLQDKRQYSERDITRLLQKAVRRMSLQSATFQMTEEYDLGSGLFVPTFNIQEYDKIAYEDAMDMYEPYAPEYKINNDNSVEVDETTIVTEYGPLMFRYWYIPNIEDDAYIAFGDRSMELFDQYMKIEVYKFTKDKESLKYAIDELNFLLSTSIDSDHDECVRDVYNKGFV